MFLGLNGVAPRKPGRPRKQGEEEVINESGFVMGVDGQPISGNRVTTGRENIYLNGAILGMGRDKRKARLETTSPKL